MTSKNGNKMTADESTKLVQLGMIMERLTEEVAKLSDKLEYLKDEKVAVLNTSHEVMSDRVNHLQKCVYGAVGAVFIEGLGILGILLVWLITRGSV